MNLQHLRYFVTLAHMRHYTRAAQALAITQPSLSNAISLMEEELGVPLFAKSGLGVALTRSGEEFLEHTERALRTLDEGVAAVRRSADDAQNLLLRKDRSRLARRRWVLYMREYELMVILEPSIDERTVAPMMEKYLAPVAANGGSVENVDVWGKRRLAYDILKRSEGIYVVIDMTTTPEVALEINRRMGIDETILRTKLLRPDAH